jgi:hypothetical protein
MLWDKPDQQSLLENQLILFVSDQPPTTNWQRFLDQYPVQVLFHDDLFSALGAFVMLMPGIVIVDRYSAVGIEALSHIEDVLGTAPQPLLILIELGSTDCTAQHGNVVRVGAPLDTTPDCVMSRAWTTLSRS